MVTLALAQVTAAPPSRVDFSGTRVTVVSCLPPGGGVDISTRLLIPEAAKRLPGSPNVSMEYKNVPYAAVNDFYKSAPRDGTQILSCHNAPDLGELLGRPDVNYHVAQLRPIVVLPNPQVYLIRSDTGFTAPKDLLALKRPLIYGHIEPDSPPDVPVIFFSKMVPAIPMKFIFGYRTGGDASLAQMRGEIDMAPQGPDRFYDGALQDEIQSGDLKVAFQLGVPGAGGALARDPAYPSAPTLGEVYRDLTDRAPGGPAWQIIVSMAGLQQIGLAWYLPPGTPDDVYRAWTTAMADALADPVVLDRIRKLTRVTPITGAEAARAVAGAMSLSPNVRQLLRQTLMSDFHMKF